jgi:hypothetical protein
MLLGEGETLVVGVAFWALAMVALIVKATAIAEPSSSFPPHCKFGHNTPTGSVSLAFRTLNSQAKLKTKLWNAWIDGLAGAFGSGTRSSVVSFYLCAGRST